MKHDNDNNRTELQKAVDRVEQLGIQLAGCSMAALGLLEPEVKEGDYGWSAAYQDVANIRRLFEKEHRELLQLKDWLRDQVDLVRDMATAAHHARKLYDLLDEIDTLSDATKGDYEAFYRGAMRLVGRRKEHGQVDGDGKFGWEPVAASTTVRKEWLPTYVPHRKKKRKQRLYSASGPRSDAMVGLQERLRERREEHGALEEAVEGAVVAQPSFPLGCQVAACAIYAYAETDHSCPAFDGSWWSPYVQGAGSAAWRARLDRRVSGDGLYFVARFVGEEGPVAWQGASAHSPAHAFYELAAKTLPIGTKQCARSVLRGLETVLRKHRGGFPDDGLVRPDAPWLLVPEWDHHPEVVVEQGDHDNPTDRRLLGQYHYVATLGDGSGMRAAGSTIQVALYNLLAKVIDPGITRVDR